MAHLRQSRTDSGLGCQVEVPDTKVRFWPWLSSKSPRHLLQCSLLSRKRVRPYPPELLPTPVSCNLNPPQPHTSDRKPKNSRFYTSSPPQTPSAPPGPLQRGALLPPLDFFWIHIVPSHPHTCSAMVGVPHRPLLPSLLTHPPVCCRCRLEGRRRRRLFLSQPSTSSVQICQLWTGKEPGHTKTTRPHID